MAGESVADPPGAPTPSRFAASIGSVQPVTNVGGQGHAALEEQAAAKGNDRARVVLHGRTPAHPYYANSRLECPIN